MIFVDANVPMYLIGAAHPNKDRARALLDELIETDQKLVSDVEVLQEILHRYSFIHRREAIEPAFQLLYSLVEEWFDIERADLERAKSLLLSTPSLSARDALHAATMERNGVLQILSFDSGFDAFRGITRLS